MTSAGISGRGTFQRMKKAKRAIGRMKQARILSSSTTARTAQVIYRTFIGLIMDYALALTPADEELKPRFYEMDTQFFRAIIAQCGTRMPNRRLRKFLALFRVKWAAMWQIVLQKSLIKHLKRSGRDNDPRRRWVDVP